MGKYRTMHAQGRANIAASRRGKRSNNWKGEEASYVAKHNWVRTKLGAPNECENCQFTSDNRRQFNWANISGEYKRDLTDWARLCVRCHALIDDLKRKQWATRKNNYLVITVRDTILVKDKIHTYKKWFNGMHHFFTVKVLPKKN